MKGQAFMRFLESEPPVVLKPFQFDEWYEEIGLVADCEGAWAVVGMFWSASEECCRYLVSHPSLWESLLARGRYSDRRRFETGVTLGRRAGL